VFLFIFESTPVFRRQETHKMNTPYRPLVAMILILLPLILCISCLQEYEEPIIPPSQFTKAQREALGKEIKIAIAFNEQFVELPNIPPYDTSIYDYIQTLYNQVTNQMRLDRQSPSNNRWSSGRTWEITILQHPEKNIFVLPGGNLYLTTGLLRALESENELYYLLAFEATLMNEKFLFHKIINTFNTNMLSKIADGYSRRNEPSAADIVDIIDKLDFDNAQTREVDQLTTSLICRSSIMDPLGIARLSEINDNTWYWLDYRSNYPGRAEYIQRIIDRSTETCGDFTTNGNYSRLVLGML